MPKSRPLLSREIHRSPLQSALALEKQGQKPYGNERDLSSGSTDVTHHGLYGAMVSYGQASQSDHNTKEDSYRFVLDSVSLCRGQEYVHFHLCPQ